MGGQKGHITLYNFKWPPGPWANLLCLLLLTGSTLSFPKKNILIKMVPLWLRWYLKVIAIAYVIFQKTINSVATTVN